MDATDRWIVAGEPGNGEKGVNAGAAYLYDATTGGLRRKLLAPDGAAGDNFGHAVSVSADIIVIGTPGYDLERGAVYAFHAGSGKLLGRISQTNPFPGDRFGEAVALEGDFLVVGAPGRDIGLGALFRANIKGLAGSFEMPTSGELVASTRVAGTGFGSVLETDGRIIVAGVPLQNAGDGGVYWFDVISKVPMQLVHGSGGEGLGSSLGIAVKRIYAGAPAYDSRIGRVRIYDVVTGSEFAALNSPEPASDTQFGLRMAIGSGRLVVSAPLGSFLGEGGLHVFDLHGVLAGTLHAPRAQSFFNLGGSSVAVTGNAVLASATPGGNAVGYRFFPVAVPLPRVAKPIAKVKDFAPGSGNGAFASFQSVTLANRYGIDDVLFMARTDNALSGVWRHEGNDSFGPTTVPAILRTSNLSPMPSERLFVRQLGVPMFNNSTRALFSAYLKAPASRDQALLFYDPSGPIPTYGVQLREGGDITIGAYYGTRKLAAMHQVVQSNNSTSGYFSIAAKFAGVRAAYDTGVILFDKSNEVKAWQGEGLSGSPGQISPRVALQTGRVLFHARTFDPLQDQALLTFSTSDRTETVLVAGQPISTRVGIVSSILGETISVSGGVLAKLTLKGRGISTANNEVLVQNGSAKSMAEGDIATDLPNGAFIARFVRFWAVGGQNVAQVVLRGPAVNASSDQALILAEEDSGRLRTLFREGDAAPGCDGARIGVIQQVEIAPSSGNYAVVVSLVGGAPGRDQALYLGGTFDAWPPRQSLRKPWLALRKGQLVSGSFGAAATVNTIALGTSASDATGASGKGLPTPINDTSPSFALWKAASRDHRGWRRG